MRSNPGTALSENLSDKADTITEAALVYTFL
jgi:hypothetical protein